MKIEYRIHYLFFHSSLFYRVIILLYECFYAMTLLQFCFFLCINSEIECFKLQVIGAYLLVSFLHAMWD